LRHDVDEDFVYLGEAHYETHREITSERDGRVQQEYVLRLAHQIPEGLLSELTAGAVRRRAGPRARIGRRAGGEAGRRTASLDGYKKAFSYALGRLDRTVEPGTTTTKSGSSSSFRPRASAPSGSGITWMCGSGSATACSSGRSRLQDGF